MRTLIQQNLEAFLTEKGLRRTKQRGIIVRAASSAENSFNADQLHDMTRALDRTVSRATVYRTLRHLVEFGLLRKLDSDSDQAHYECVASPELKLTRS